MFNDISIVFLYNKCIFSWYQFLLTLTKLLYFPSFNPNNQLQPEFNQPQIKHGQVQVKNQTRKKILSIIVKTKLLAILQFADLVSVVL